MCEHTYTHTFVYELLFSGRVVAAVAVFPLVYALRSARLGYRAILLLRNTIYAPILGPPHVAFGC